MNNQLQWPAHRIRQTYLEFFKAKGHKIVPSDSLVPQGDPTLLFSGAGMNQFKEYFLGIKKDMTRATSSQKCLRTGDLDNVGKTPYHHSFFEMLGNFSFGDYFKEEAIQWAMELLTGPFGVPRERLRVSVHRNDDEAFVIWRDKIRVPENWIAKLGDDSNFWPANAPKDGPNGPCGPCSEIFFDQGAEVGCGKPACGVDCDCGRFAEIWNLVFTQFDRQDGGKLVPLKQKNIDTGAGLERWACVLQGKRNNFETDLLRPLVDHALKLNDAPASEADPLKLSSARMIADHGRAALFAIADGALPSNEGRGYVVRKLIRRAVWKAEYIKPKLKPFLYQVAEKAAEIMGEVYPYLRNELKHVQTVLRGEEERFLDTLEDGKQYLNRIVQQTRDRGSKIIAGDEAFKLYDTYGLPYEIGETVAQQAGMTIEKARFEQLMEEQRQRAKDSTKIADSIFVVSETNPELSKQPHTEFLGYQTLKAEGKVLFAEINGSEGWILLDRTPFYAEKGGQVGDRGRMSWQEGMAAVLDTQWKDQWILHRIRLEKGSIKTGMKISAEVDENLRERTRRHHTATHILQAALRNVLGTHVRQLGSLVNPEKLRFDFSHSKALTDEEIRKVEEFVNSAVLRNLPVTTDVMSFDESQKKGVLAFFGEKYGEKVRVLDVGPGVSVELCGGTHVKQTGDIGSFLITSESSIASGTRRIEAVAGIVAVEHMQKMRGKIDALAASLKASPEELLDRLEKLQQKLKEAQKGGGAKVSGDQVEKIIQKAEEFHGIQLVNYSCPDVEMKALREYESQINARLKNRESVVVLFSWLQDSASFLASSTASKVSANDVVKEIASITQGSGGGKKEFAQGGSKHPELIAQAAKLVPQIVEKFLKK